MRRLLAYLFLSAPLWATLSVTPTVLTTGNINRYDLYEVSLAYTYTPTYDDSVAVDVDFTAPDGTTHYTVHGFYYGTNEWRFRFSPRTVGAWNWSLTVNNGSDTYSTTGSFTCVTGSYRGWLKLDPNNSTRHFATEGDNQPIYLLGLQGQGGHDGGGGYSLGGDPPTLGNSIDTFLCTQRSAGFNMWRENGQIMLMQLQTVSLDFNISGSGHNNFSESKAIEMDVQFSKLHEYGFHLMLDFFRDGNPSTYTSSYDLSNPNKAVKCCSNQYYYQEVFLKLPNCCLVIFY